MKRDWIKLDVGILDDPAYGTLPDDLWRLMIQLTMLAGEVDKDGLLPAARDMAWELHIGLGTLQISLHHLAERGLLHSTPQGWVVTGFKESQSAPNSTERSRAFRMRRKSATQDKQAGNEKGVGSAAKEEVQEATQAAAEMQPARPQPVAGSVPTSDHDPAQPGRPGKNRLRHKTKGLPEDNPAVENYPVDQPVERYPGNGFPQEKGRKNSDSMLSTSSTSSLINSLKPSLNIKLPLLELPDGEHESEKFRPTQAKIPENRRGEPGSTPLANAPQPEAGQARVTPEILREIVEPYRVDKPVDNSVDTCPGNGFPQEKGRKDSDPDEHPP